MTVTKKTVLKERAPGGDIPEVVMQWFAMHPDLFQQYQSHERDTARLMKLSKSGVTKEDAEALAWLLWRARMVQGWSAVNRVPTRTWAEAVESAWLKDELFLMCSERRKQHYAEQQARRDRLEQAMLTGVEGNHGLSLSAKAAAKAQRRATKNLTPEKAKATA